MVIEVFSKEDKVLVKRLHERKIYDAQQFMIEFQNEGWMKISINRLLVVAKLIKYGTTVDRCPRSGRQRTARTDGVVESLTVQSQDNMNGHV